MVEACREVNTAAIIPAFNEESRVGNVVRAALRADTINAVIVVDDRSRDDTARCAEDAFKLEQPEGKSITILQRNVFTDTLLVLLKQGGHAGNRAIKLEIWDRMMADLQESGKQLNRWEIEGALNAYTKRISACEVKERQGAFMMHGVINVGSRIKAGGLLPGMRRMVQIHTQALKGAAKFRSRRLGD